MEIAPAGTPTNGGAGEAVKLTVTHTIARDTSRFIDAVTGGWPQILSNLKSLLETGAPVLGSRP